MLTFQIYAKLFKLTMMCLVVLSILAMVGMINQLDKNVSVVDTYLSYTEDKLRTIKDTHNRYR